MVSGHLQVKKGYYYAVLSFYDSKNKRHVKYISTGLPEKGNKRKAEAELVKIRNAFEPPAEIGELCSNMLFADYLLGWLEIVKVRVKPTTFGSYESMQKAISKYWPVFVLPTLIAFIIGFIWPFIWGSFLSFQRFTTVSKTTFVGIQNYISVFQDSTFLHAFGFTAAFTVVSTVLINVCAFAIAIVLTRGIKGTNIFRTVYFMPNLIGGILLGYIWQILLNGVLANLQKPLLALDAKAGFVGLVILMCWQQIGYMMIIYVAGLQSVPGDLIEAAKIDGASDREILFKIKLPMVMPSITICTFLTLTNSFKLFDQNVALTAGEPANASEMLALNIYNTFYGRSGAQWKGIGQAKAVVFFLIVVVISLVQLHFTRSKEVQQ